MRKPVVPSFILIAFLFIAVFVLLIHLQFSKRTEFAQRVANLVIQGNYAREHTQGLGAFTLSGGASVIFGGLEFLLKDGLTLASEWGEEESVPSIMTVTDNEVSFLLAQGPELVFTTQYTGGALELVIRSDFSANQADGGFWQSLQIPFKVLATSFAQKKNDSLLIHTDGTNYTFMQSTGSDSIMLTAQNPVINYRAIPDREAVNPLDFIHPVVIDIEEYNAALALWLDRSYSTWNNAILRRDEPELLTGELINAYVSEALKRGTYKAAIAAVSQLPHNAAVSTWEASPYIGRFDSALRLFVAAERERAARVARLFNEKSLEFLKEYRIINYLGIRGFNNLMDDASSILRAFDPAQMTVEQAAGILEGGFDWARFRPDRHNPYDRFLDQALFVVSESLQKEQLNGYALVFTQNGHESADTELNLRLGNALVKYEDEIINALGKTLIYSVLSMAETSGAIPARVVWSPTGFAGNGEFLDSSYVYRICFAAENYARALDIGQGLWAWTAATSVEIETSQDTLNISVSFAPGETHFMMIRGIKPFNTLQLNGTAVNQDAQFERFDNSGWLYSSTEQILLVKLRHRLPAERITLY